MDSIRVKRKTLQNLLEDCQRALELLNLSEISPDGGENDGLQDDDSDGVGEQSKLPEEESDKEELSSLDPEADKFYDLIKSRVECHEFRDNLELAQASVLQDLAEDGSSWDLVSEDDIWGVKKL